MGRRRVLGKVERDWIIWDDCMGIAALCVAMLSRYGHGSVAGVLDTAIMASRRISRRHRTTSKPYSPLAKSLASS